MKKRCFNVSYTLIRPKSGTRRPYDCQMIASSLLECAKRVISLTEGNAENLKVTECQKPLPNIDLESKYNGKVSVNSKKRKPIIGLETLHLKAPSNSHLAQH